MQLCHRPCERGRLKCTSFTEEERGNMLLRMGTMAIQTHHGDPPEDPIAD